MGNVISASKIAKFLNAVLQGKNLKIKCVSSLNNPKNASILFTKKDITSIKIFSDVLVLVPLDYEEDYHSFSIIKVENPRLSFAKVVEEFFIVKTSPSIHPSVVMGENSIIPKTVSIGANCFIGKNVKIGEYSKLNQNIVVEDNSVIGKNCYVKSGTVIGEDGFGFDFENDGTPIRIPHLGTVIIGDNVEIGANNTIARGTLDNTIIHDNVKTDDQVHIAHNCNIGENTIITACSEISGSVTIGKGCWLGPNCSIMQKVEIGDTVIVGIGSIVTQNIENKKKIMGLDALELRSLVKLKKRIEFGK